MKIARDVAADRLGHRKTVEGEGSSRIRTLRAETILYAAIDGQGDE